MIVEKDGKYFNLQLSHNIGSKAQRDWFPITKTEFDGYMKKVGSNTEVNKNQVNKNDYYSKRPIILIPSNQYEAITKKFIGEYKNGKLAKPADYTDKWLDQEVNDMLKLVDDTKKKGSSDRSSITFDPTPFGQ